MTIAELYARMKLRLTIPENPDGCWLWQGGRTTKGYGNFGGSAGQLKWMIYCHRLSFEYHRGPIPRGLCICHSCDVPWCVNPRHLFLGTKGDNNRDMARKGRNARGARHWWAKLNEQQVIEILNLLSHGQHPRRIAEVFGVSSSCIKSIQTGESWKHLLHVDRLIIANMKFPRSDKGTRRATIQP